MESETENVTADVKVLLDTLDKNLRAYDRHSRAANILLSRADNEIKNAVFIRKKLKELLA